MDVLVLSYITKLKVISVGYYLNGFILNNTQSYLNQMLRLEENNISENDTVYVYFYNIGRPLDKMTNGNHFAYIWNQLQYKISSLRKTQFKQLVTDCIQNGNRKKHENRNVN